MKKIILLLAVLIVIVPVFATYTEPSTRSMAMGGISVISNEKQDSFLNNPANLVNSYGYFQWLPSVNVNLYSITDLEVGKVVKGFFNKDLSTIAAAVAKYYMDSHTGSGNILGLDLNAGYIQNGFGLRADLSENITSYIPRGNTGNSYSEYTQSSDLKFTAAKAFEFDFENNTTLNVGAALSLDLEISRTADIGNALEYVNDSKTNFPKTTSFSFPLNIGAVYSLKSLKAGLVARNILGFNFYSVKTGDEKDSYSEYNAPEFDTGLAFIHDFETVQITLEADLQNILNSFESKRVFFKNFHAGAELGIQDTYFIRGGLNSGYWTIGAGLKFYRFNFDFAYYYKENGVEAGDRSQQCVSFRFTFGNLK